MGLGQVCVACSLLALCQEQQGSGRYIFGLPQLKIWHGVGRDRLCKLSLCCSAQHCVPSTAVLVL